MTDIGNLNDAINAQAVILEINTGSLDEVITLHNIKRNKIHPIHRTNTRGGPRDQYSWSIIELTFVCLVTKDMSAIFDALNSLDSRSKLPLDEFTLTGLSLSGAAEDDIVGPFNATVPDYERDAGESGDYVARIKLRIDEGSTPT